MGRILYEVDSVQYDFELYLSSERGLWKKGLWVVIGMELWKFSVLLFVGNYYEYYVTVVYVVTKRDKIVKSYM
jgi:hypothetical protein